MGDFLATDLLKSKYYSIRSKLLKAIAISNLGYINEAYQLLIKVKELKDIPI